MSPEVEKAIDALYGQYGRDRVLIAADRDGGAYAIVEGVPIGTPFAQPDTWFGFHIPSICPYADVYPHFVRADLSRTDASPLGEGFSSGANFPDPAALKQPGAMPTRPAVQISRRSNHKDVMGLETPLLKLLKVIKWLLSR
jgi:hypothetical protein